MQPSGRGCEVQESVSALCRLCGPTGGTSPVLLHSDVDFIQLWYVCMGEWMCWGFTEHRAAQHLHPHAQGAVPALRDDADITRQHRHCQLVHHWSVCVTVPKEQLHDADTEKDTERVRDTWVLREG